jgi:hypothetical protein
MGGEGLRKPAETRAVGEGRIRICAMWLGLRLRPTGVHRALSEDHPCQSRTHTLPLIPLLSLPLSLTFDEQYTASRVSAPSTEPCWPERRTDPTITRYDSTPLHIHGSLNPARPPSTPTQRCRESLEVANKRRKVSSSP